MLKKIITLTILIVQISFTASAQNDIDKIVAIVGNKTILLSDIENQKLQAQTQGYSSPNLRCEILEDLLFQKLLLNQAILDSIEITDNEITAELNRRMQYFISQIGSEKKLEEFYNKSIVEIKDDFKEVIKDQLITQRMQSTLTGDVKITPSEIRKYFNKIPKDSLPLINTEIELEQIVLHPKVEEEQIKAIKERLEGYREQVKNGKSFSTLAVMYSEDPGSASKGGELGLVGRGDLVPEFAALAFNLKEGEVSRIVKTDFGYHIIKLEEKKGEKINCRHILLTPKVSPLKMIETKRKLDSIATLIRNDTITFKKAALYYSNDKNTKFNGGLVFNSMTSSSKFEIGELDPATSYAIKDLKTNEISKPFESTDENGKQVYKIVRLKSKTQPHNANLQDDYQKIQSSALEEKQSKLINNWIKTKVKTTYIKIDDDFTTCNFKIKNWIK